MMRLVWNRNETPAELIPMLEILGEEYPLHETGRGVKLRFRRIASETLSVRIERGRGRALVTYSAPAAAARGIGTLLAGGSEESVSTFKSVGIMLDFSRNMVMTVEHLKKWLRRFALSGGNLALLYMEDVYKLEGEPFFGCCRGAFTREELRAVDAYAAALGIELVGCIQTLAHLAQVLQWPAYDAVRDTPDCLLVGEEKSYALIDRIFRFWSTALSSRRIHIGMDEAHALGRGAYLDRNGFRPPFELMAEHLRKVEKMAALHGLRPMIWSDMFFSLSGGGYYNPDVEFPPDLPSGIPPRTGLVYWDYYHRETEFYRRMIRAHRKLNGDPIMASGIWTMQRWWYDPWQTNRTVRPCIEACREEKIGEIFFTLWKDDGAYCCYDSALAGVALCCDLCYGQQDERRTARRFSAVCHADYQTVVAAGAMNAPMGFELEEEAAPIINPAPLLWDDPLIGIAYDFYLQLLPAFPSGTLKLCKRLRKRLQPHAESREAGDIGFALALLRLLELKLKIRKDLLRGYFRGDRKLLREVESSAIPEALAALRDFERAFRRQWLDCAGPQGMEVIQLRNGGVGIRLEETAQRIREYLDGTVRTIAELDDRLPEVKGFLAVNRYSRVVSASALK